MKKTISFMLTSCTLFLFLMCDTEKQLNTKPNTDNNRKKISIESWIENNSETLSSYGRNEIATYSRSVQKAILRSFSAKKRKQIWQLKVDYLLTSPEFSKEERKYLLWFAEKFKTLSYEKAFDINLSHEMYDKVIEGISIFGWSNEKAYKMFFTIGDLNNIKNGKNLKSAPSEDKFTWCECYYDLGCPNWDCDSKADCDGSSGNPHDCGIFGGTDCDGNC